MPPKTLTFTLIVLSLSCQAFSQTSKSQAELARLQTAVENAKNKVALNEKKIAAADSVIEAGKRMIDEAKSEVKMIDSESKKYEKEFEVRYKHVKKLTGSKDKTVAKKATSDLRALDNEHRKTNDSLVTRMNISYKKQATGLSTINKGKNSKASAKEALNAAEKSLDAARKKYEEATAPGKKSTGKSTGKK
jgi:hypothetical protein